MAKVPEQTHSGQLNRSKIVARPSAGTTSSKTHDETATLRSGNLPVAEEVRTVDMNANKGAAIKAALIQSQGDGAELNVTNGDPKKRERNSWGVHRGEEK